MGSRASDRRCEPGVTCVTSIELEHTDRLGTTLEAIAGEKARILKSGVPAVMGALPEPARQVVEARAAELSAPLAALGRDFQCQAEERGLAGSRVHFHDGGFSASFDLPVPGPVAPINAALAIACVRRLLADAPAPAADWIQASLGRVQLPGRIEVLGREPWIVVDAAHTAASVGALVHVLRALAAPVDLVLSISADKDAEGLLRALLPLARRVTLTRAEPTRSLPPERIAQVAASLAPDVELRTVPNPHLALRAAREAVSPDAVLCATGSVYLAGIARAVLRDPEAGRRVAVTRSRSRREPD